jgi:hypothetical protein
MRRQSVVPAVAVLVTLALTVGACAGDDNGDAKTTTSAPTSPAPSGDGSATPPASPSQLPPEFARCMADQGYDIESSADIHSAPPEVLQACFGAIHGGGG